MKRNFTPLTALIFILLAAVGSANAGDCMKLCDGSVWRKNPTLADVKAEIAKGADIHDDIAGYTPLHFAEGQRPVNLIRPDNRLYRTATHDRLRAIDGKINIAPPIMH